MIIMLEVDGGVNGSCSHSLEIDDGEILKCDDLIDALGFIEEYVQGEFEHTTSWTFVDYEAMFDEIENILERKE